MSSLIIQNFSRHSTACLAMRRRAQISSTDCLSCLQCCSLPMGRIMGSPRPKRSWAVTFRMLESVMGRVSDQSPGIRAFGSRTASPSSSSFGGSCSRYRMSLNSHNSLASPPGTTGRRFCADPCTCCFSSRSFLTKGCHSVLLHCRVSRSQADWWWARTAAAWVFLCEDGLEVLAQLLFPVPRVGEAALPLLGPSLPDDRSPARLTTSSLQALCSLRVDTAFHADLQGRLLVECSALGGALL